MANKFSQSIIERLEQESIQQKKAEDRAAVINPSTNRSEKNGTIKEVEKESPPFARDLSAYLQNNARRQAKNKTFYLDEDLTVALKRAARQQGVAESRLVNDILRKVLGI